MNKCYESIGWKNGEIGGTPLGEHNLNKMDVALNEIDNRVVTMDTTKANQSDLLTTISDVTFDEKTGLFTFTKKNGATFSIDTKIEKLAINFVFDEATQQIVITLDDGTKQHIDVSAFISQLDFLNSATVNLIVVDGKVKAEIVKGSITGEYLEPNYLANVTAEASRSETACASAEASARRAEDAAGVAQAIAGFEIDTVLDANSYNPIANRPVAEAINSIISGTYLATSILEYALTAPVGEHFIRLPGSSYTGNDLPLVNYAYGTATINVRNSNAIRVVLWGSHAADTRRIAVNFYNGTAWSGWDTDAKTSDLANYFKNTGGALSGNVLLRKTTAETATVLVGNTNGEISMRVDANGTRGLFDNTISDYLLYNDGTNKVFKGTASGNLPLSGGGEVAANSTKPMSIKNTSSGVVYLGFNGKNGAVGSFGFAGANRPMFMESDGNTGHDILHTGNVGSYALRVNEYGMVDNGAFSPLSINNSGSGTGSAMSFKTQGTNMGFLGFKGINMPVFINTDNARYDLLHTGNSAKVAIQETAPTDGLWVW